MRHSAQKISKIYSDLRGTRCAPQVLFFVPPTFQMKVTPLDLNIFRTVNCHLVHVFSVWSSLAGGAWRSGNALCRIHEVTLRWARLVLGWVTLYGAGKPSRYEASQLGRLSLLPSVGWKTEYQLAGWVIINGDGECSHYSCQLRRIYWLRLIGLVQRSAATRRCVLHLSNEPGELWQWQCHDGSTINTVAHCYCYYY